MMAKDLGGLEGEDGAVGEEQPGAALGVAFLVFLVVLVAVAVAIALWGAWS